MATYDLQVPLPLEYGPDSLANIIATAGGPTPDTSQGVTISVTGKGAAGAHGTTSGGIGGGGGAFAQSEFDSGIWSDSVLIATQYIYGSVYAQNGTGVASENTTQWLVMAADAFAETGGQDAESFGDLINSGGDGGTVALTGGGGGGGAATGRPGDPGANSFGTTGGNGGLSGDGQPSGGNGGSGGGTPTAAEDGLEPGGGGGGGYGSGGGGGAGGAGGEGRVIITYTVLAASGDSQGNGAVVLLEEHE